MEDSTSPPPSADRRSGDRRRGTNPDYAGPERRVADRRSGLDRRRSPRIDPLG
jgi:hypothetical protein